MIKTLYPCFRHWSEGGSVYLVSDTHFFDPDRKFMGYEISEYEQINRIKKFFSKNDTLIHLGDVGNPELIDEIKCYKVLIMGNHDTGASNFEPYFDEVYTGPLWISQKLVLSHEPICLEAGVTRAPIAFNIHGHDHSGESYNDDYHLNICQNVFGYIPLNLKGFINSGILKKVDSIHRETINNARSKHE